MAELAARVALLLALCAHWRLRRRARALEQERDDLRYKLDGEFPPRWGL